MLKLKRLLSLLLITAVLLSSNAMLYASALIPEDSNDENTPSLPSAVDLSETPYFPELSGTCETIMDQDYIDTTIFSTIHYQFTYMMNRARGVETTFENTFSPLFGNNMMHENLIKGDYETNYEQIYTLLKNVGCATNKNIPFLKDHSNSYTSWPGGRNTWREATKNRILNSFDYKLIGDDDTQITSPDDYDLNELKTALSNGEMPCVTCPYTAFVHTEIKAHEDAPANEELVGKRIGYEMKMFTGEQAKYNTPETVALVGYDDNVWCDINGNDEIDSGEMGAFKLAHSENMGYFTYVAYDALNKTSCVEDPIPNLSPGERVAAFVAIKGIEVEKERSEKEIYVQFRPDLYSPFEIYFTAEANGEKYEKKFLDGINYVETDNIFYGPATMIFPLSDLVPGLNGENFDDYVFTMTIKNMTTMENHFLDIEEITLVNEYDGTESSVTENSDIRIEPLGERNIPLTQNTFVYYLGYDNVTLHYRTDDGEFKSAPMEKGKYQFFGVGEKVEPFTNSRCYSYKYYLEGITDAEIYFTDDEGHVDDNNGQYYKTVTGNNFYFTEGLRDPLTISEITLTNGTPDVGKYSYFDVEYSGGYAPRQILCYATNLDTGKEEQYWNDYDQYRPYYNFKKAGNYRISVHIKDFKGDVVSSAIEVKVVDNPFAMTTTADKNECFVSEPINFESVTSFENFDISKDSITSSAKYVVKNSDNNVVWDETIVTDDVDVDGNTSTSHFTYFPRLSGNYTLTVTKTDKNNETVENTVEFTVLDKLIGDADGDGLVTIVDATLVQRTVAQMTCDGKFYEILADVDNDTEINIIDATYIQRYVAELDDCGNAGETTEYVTPKNTITFTNNLGWEDVYCHYSCKDTLEKIGWPGVSMVKTGVNEKGEAVYSVEIPQSTTRLCFTNKAAETRYIDFDGTDTNYTAVDNGTGSFYEVIEI